MHNVDILKSIAKIPTHIDLTDDYGKKVLGELAQLADLATKHGQEGTFTTRDFSTNNLDWYWDVGCEIERLEQALEVDEGIVRKFYIAAFKRGVAARKGQPS